MLEFTNTKEHRGNPGETGMGLEDIAKDLLVSFGKELIGLGVAKLKEVLTDDEIRDTVEIILPVESESRKTQREIEAQNRRIGFGG